MIVCRECLRAIESHNGKQKSRKVEEGDTEIVYGYISELGEFVPDANSYEEFIFCDFCEEYIPLFDAYVI